MVNCWFTNTKNNSTGKSYIIPSPYVILRRKPMGVSDSSGMSEYAVVGSSNGRTYANLYLIDNRIEWYPQTDPNNYMEDGQVEKCIDCGQVAPNTAMMELHRKNYCRQKPLEVESQTASEPVQNVQLFGKEIAPGIFMPNIDPNYKQPKWVWDGVKAVVDDGKMGLVIRGESGLGKTCLAYEIAARLHRPIADISCGAWVDPQDPFLQTRLINDNGVPITIREESVNVRGLEMENCVVLWDEANRAGDVKVLNGPFALLDQRKKAFIDILNRWVTVAPGVIVIMTLNEGMGFTGTDRLDDALRGRFFSLKLPKPPIIELTEIVSAKTGLSKVVVRKVIEAVPGCDTRSYLKIASLMTQGLGMGLAARFGLDGNDDVELEKKLQALQLGDGTQIDTGFVECPFTNGVGKVEEIPVA